ncbi:MAG: creatininase family protein [Myxococcota bacterium]
MSPQTVHLAQMTYPEAAELYARRPIALWPVGSTEPHGPHLALRTDVVIAEGMAQHAATRLLQRELPVMILPSLPFGVTEFGRDFAGALSVPAAALVEMIVGVATCLKRDGARALVLCNAHLEPGHLQALRDAARAATERTGLPTCFPDKTSRPIARSLSAEFKSGACHAGQYETSLVLAQEPTSVRSELASGLPPVEISLSKAILGGKTSFKEAGGERAYFGFPAQATAGEGEALYATLADHVVRETLELLGSG